MFQPEGSISGRRRPYVTRACNECRRRRCKCDGKQPTCGTCTTSGHSCSWNADTEVSRPFTKQYVESLRVKVKSLESEIAQLQTGSSTFFTGLPPDTPSSSSLGEEPLDEFQRPPFLPSILLDPLSTFTSTTNSEFSTTPSLHASELNAFHSTPAFQYQYTFNIDLSIPFEHQTPEIQATLSCQWDRHLPDLGQVYLSRIEHDGILSQYFNNGASWLSGLVPSLFLRDMMRSLSPQSTTITTHLNNYSPLLHCSILSFASTFSDNPYIKANDARVKFATQAKSWLFDQFGNFHPTLLPSLVLLAEYHNVIGERNTGYMYLGMGIRAIKAAPIPTGISTYTWYSWSIYAQEAFSALESGRSNQMPLPRIPIDSPTEHLGDHSSLEAEAFVRSCKLAVIATEVNRNTPSDSSSIAKLQLQLDAWYNSLPHRLLFSQRVTFMHSHVYCLHIAYWWITLQLHLPLYRQGRTKGSVIGQDRSIKMCNRATENLVQLFTEFDKQYTLRCFPGTLLQAITLCGDALLLERAQTPDGASRRREKAQEGIDSCIRALQTAGKTWSHAQSLAEKFQARATE